MIVFVFANLKELRPLLKPMFHQDRKISQNCLLTTVAEYIPKIGKKLESIRSIKLAVCSPGLIPGINAPPLLRLSAISFELNVKASQI